MEMFCPDTPSWSSSVTFKHNMMLVHPNVIGYATSLYLVMITSYSYQLSLRS